MAQPDQMPAGEDNSALGAFWLPRTTASDLIEKFINGVGAVINWLWVLLMLVIVANVFMRYALATNYVWIEETQWHMYAVGFMLGIGYAISCDTHVRVDIAAQNMRLRTRAVIELIGIVFLMLPLFAMIIAYAVPFVQNSWVRNEISSAPGGLTHRWAIKSVLIVAFSYMVLAAVARLLRLTALLTGFPRPLSHPHPTAGAPHA